MDTKLKICHFTYSFFPLVGGMEEMIHNISLALLSLGHKPFVFAPYVRGKDNSLDVPYIVLRFSRPSSKRFGVSQLIIPLLCNYNKYHFDILHCHGAYPSGYIGALFHQITGVPLIITPHGGSGDVEKNDRGHIINSRITRRINKVFSKALAVTAISTEIKKHILDFGTDPDKIYSIPNGVFLDEFKMSDTAKKKCRNNNTYILYIGSLIRRKGVDILIKAFLKVKKNILNLKLKIAGEGPEKGKLMELVNELKISDSVSFLGIVRGREKIQLLNDAILLACPSRREPFGIVVLEGFASGIPVIASRVGGIPDIIKDGENGVLIEPENPEQLAEKIELFINDNIFRKKLSENALSTIGNFDWNHIVKKYIEIYKKFLRD